MMHTTAIVIVHPVELMELGILLMAGVSQVQDNSFPVYWMRLNVLQCLEEHGLLMMMVFGTIQHIIVLLMLKRREIQPPVLFLLFWREIAVTMRVVVEKGPV